MQKYRPNDNENGIPVLKIKELKQGFCDANSERCTNAIDDTYIVNTGDIIFAWSASLMLDVWASDICGLNQHLFKIISNNYYK